MEMKETFRKHWIDYIPMLILPSLDTLVPKFILKKKRGGGKKTKKSFNFCFAFFHETTADKIYNFWTLEESKSSISFEAWYSVT